MENSEGNISSNNSVDSPKNSVLNREKNVDIESFLESGN